MNNNLKEQAKAMEEKGKKYGVHEMAKSYNSGKLLIALAFLVIVLFVYIL